MSRNNPKDGFLAETIGSIIRPTNNIQHFFACESQAFVSFVSSTVANYNKRHRLPVDPAFISRIHEAQNHDIDLETVQENASKSMYYYQQTRKRLRENYEMNSSGRKSTLSASRSAPKNSNVRAITNRVNLDVTCDSVQSHDDSMAPMELNAVFPSHGAATNNKSNQISMLTSNSTSSTVRSGALTPSRLSGHNSSSHRSNTPSLVLTPGKPSLKKLKPSTHSVKGQVLDLEDPSGIERILSKPEFLLQSDNVPVSDLAQSKSMTLSSQAQNPTIEPMISTTTTTTAEHDQAKYKQAIDVFSQMPPLSSSMIDDDDEVAQAGLLSPIKTTAGHFPTYHATSTKLTKSNEHVETKPMHPTITPTSTSTSTGTPTSGSNQTQKILSSVQSVFSSYLPWGKSASKADPTTPSTGTEAASNSNPSATTTTSTSTTTASVNVKPVVSLDSSSEASLSQCEGILPKPAINDLETFSDDDEDDNSLAIQKSCEFISPTRALMMKNGMLPLEPLMNRSRTERHTPMSRTHQDDATGNNPFLSPKDKSQRVFFPAVHEHDVMGRGLASDRKENNLPSTDIEFEKAMMARIMEASFSEEKDLQNHLQNQQGASKSDDEYFSKLPNLPHPLESVEEGNFKTKMVIPHDFDLGVDQLNLGMNSTKDFLEFASFSPIAGSNATVDSSKDKSDKPVVHKSASAAATPIPSTKPKPVTNMSSHPIDAPQFSSPTVKTMPFSKPLVSGIGASASSTSNLASLRNTKLEKIKAAGANGNRVALSPLSSSAVNNSATASGKLPSSSSSSINKPSGSCASETTTFSRKRHDEDAEFLTPPPPPRQRVIILSPSNAKNEEYVLGLKYWLNQATPRQSNDGTSEAFFANYMPELAKDQKKNDLGSDDLHENDESKKKKPFHPPAWACDSEYLMKQSKNQLMVDADVIFPEIDPTKLDLTKIFETVPKYAPSRARRQSNIWEVDKLQDSDIKAYNKAMKTYYPSLESIRDFEAKYTKEV